MSFSPLTGDALAAATAPLMLPRRIESARLTLCMFREAHFEALARMQGDADTMRFMGGPRAYDTNWRGLISLINPDNEPSLKVAARMGATRTDQGDVGEGPMIRFVHDMRPLAGGDITGAEGAKPTPKTRTKTPRKRT